MASKIVSNLAQRELASKAVTSSPARLPPSPNPQRCGFNRSRSLPNSPSLQCVRPFFVCRNSPVTLNSTRFGASIVSPESSFRATVSLLSTKSPNSPGPRSPTQIMRSTSPIGHMGSDESESDCTVTHLPYGDLCIFPPQPRFRLFAKF